VIFKNIIVYDINISGILTRDDALTHPVPLSNKPLLPLKKKKEKKKKLYNRNTTALKIIVLFSDKQ
jgi:hypothetical protein